MVLKRYEVLPHDFDKLPKIPINDVDGNTKFYWNRLKNDDLPKTRLKEKYKFLAQCEDVVEWTILFTSNMVDLKIIGASQWPLMEKELTRLILIRETKSFVPAMIFISRVIIETRTGGAN